MRKLRYLLLSLTVFAFCYVFANKIIVRLGFDTSIPVYRDRALTYKMAEDIYLRKAILDGRSFLEQFPSTHFIRGKVDEIMLEEFEKVENNGTVLLYSFGGVSQIGIKVAQIIQDKNIRIAIIGNCISACAEFILPAASENLTFIAEPLIGFHGNTVANFTYVEELTGNYEDYCNVRHSLHTQIFLQETIGRVDFWKQHLDRLIVQKVDYKNINLSGGMTCKLVDIQTKHEMWYPTSKQLRKLFGITFTGSVCSDDFACYDTRLTNEQSNNETFVVGDKIYIVENSLPQ